VLKKIWNKFLDTKLSVVIIITSVIYVLGLIALAFGIKMCLYIIPLVFFVSCIVVSIYLLVTDDKKVKK